MKAMTKHQGMTFSGFIMMAFAFVVVAIFTLKLVPVYMESGKIQNTLDSMARDPNLQNATNEEIRLAFIKRATTMNDVTAVGSEDVIIYRDGGKLELSLKYSVKVALAGNVSLLIEFNLKAPK